MSSVTNAESRPYVASAAAGVGAWVLGYVLTYLLVATDIDGSALNRILEAFGGDSATYELVGWVFYNAHLVDVSYSGLSVFTPPANFVGGEDGFTVLLYLIPPALLLIAGLGIGRYQGVSDPQAGAIAGALLVPGYLVLSVGGVFLFSVSVGDASGAPDLIPAIAIAGLIYPVVFGAIGGALAAVTS